MRKLVTTDLFEAMRLIQRSGLKEKLVPIIEGYAKSESVERTGIMGILTAVEVFAENSCEQMIYKWLSGPLEIDPEEIKNMDLDDFAKALESLAEANDLHRFFTALSGLITRKR